MNNSNPEQGAFDSISEADRFSALFASLVVQQANIALMHLGKVNHPETGEPMIDLETAQLIIAQLEMLQTKTKGNLNKQEERLLENSLTTVRMAFVEVVDGTSGESSTAAQGAAAPAPAEGPGTPAVESHTAAQPTPKEEESRKKFTKKY